MKLVIEIEEFANSLANTDGRPPFRFSSKLGFDEMYSFKESDREFLDYGNMEKAETLARYTLLCRELEKTARDFYSEMKPDSLRIVRNSE